MIPPTLAHYRIVRPLGAGGMGEVFLAEDTKLGRRVALKVLPPAVAHDPERRERFEREARAVAALNHPNIVTLHSVEQHDDLLFLTMELVEGRPLTEVIPPQGMPAGQLLEVAIPLAGAVGAAHQRGITHRDLKPANVMVSDDGRVKVLDFGLAKLQEDDRLGGDTASTAANLTIEGRILGTSAYMSPEQAQGKPVDARSDIFSLGVVLYEMSTGERPFTGDNHLSVLSSILKDAPVPVTQVRHDLPRDLERIVRRCLEKNPDDRYQSARDLGADLKQLKQDLDSGAVTRTGAPPATSSPTVAGPAPSTASAASTTLRFAMATLGLLLIAAAGAWWYTQRQPTTPDSTELGPLKMRRLTHTGTASLAAISPDGKYVVHVVGRPGQSSLWMRQVSTASNVQIVPPVPGRYDGLTFAPDGESVVYLFYAPNSFGILYRIPFLGGPPTKLVEDVDITPAFSPDGRRMAFMRSTTDGATTILLANADGSQQAALAHRTPPENFTSRVLSWSPDGKRIAAFVGMMPFARSRVVVVDVATGHQEYVGKQRFDLPGQVAWLPDGSGLVLNAVEQGQGFGSVGQLWSMSYPGGVARRLTNDVANYTSLSMAKDGRTLAAVQEEARIGLWLAPAGDASRARELTAPTAARDGMVGIAWTPDGRIVYGAMTQGSWDLWIARGDGSPPLPLTSEPGVEANPFVLPDGRSVAFISRAAGEYRFKVRAIDLDGTNAREFSTAEGLAPGYVHVGARDVYFNTLNGGRMTLEQAPLTGGPASPVFKDVSKLPPNFAPRRISPDERWVLGTTFEPLRPGMSLAVVPLRGDGPPRVFPFPFAPGPTFPFGWAPDGRAVDVSALKDGAVNVWRFPLDGSAPKPITAFTSDEIYSYAWSKDGTTLALSRGTLSADVVLVTAEPGQSRD